MTVKATLKTRCGCQKEIETTYPPALWVIIPMVRAFPLKPEPDFDLDKALSMEVRRFKLYYFANLGPNDSYAQYVEKE